MYIHLYLSTIYQPKSPSVSQRTICHHLSDSKPSDILHGLLNPSLFIFLSFKPSPFSTSMLPDILSLFFSSLSQGVVGNFMFVKFWFGVFYFLKWNNNRNRYDVGNNEDNCSLSMFLSIFSFFFHSFCRCPQCVRASVNFHLFSINFCWTPTDRRKDVVCVLPLTVTALHGTSDKNQ